MSQKPSETEFIERVKRLGWVKETAEEFESAFGDDIRRLLVLYLWRMGLVEFRFDPERAASILTERKLELLETTLTDLWVELLKGLLSRFAEGKKTGRIRQDLLAYLAGTLRHLLVKNAQNLGLLPKEGAGEILRALCGAKSGITREQHVARLKFRFWLRIEQEILKSCPSESFDTVYQDIYHIVDYFFESYVPRRCPLISRARKHRVLSELVEQFCDSEIANARGYIGKVVPYASEARLASLSQEQQDEFLAMISV